MDGRWNCTPALIQFPDLNAGIELSTRRLCATLRLISRVFLGLSRSFLDPLESTLISQALFYYHRHIVHHSFGIIFGGTYSVSVWHAAAIDSVVGSSGSPYQHRVWNQCCHANCPQRVPRQGDVLLIFDFKCISVLPRSVCYNRLSS